MACFEAVAIEMVSFNWHAWDPSTVQIRSYWYTNAQGIDYDTCISWSLKQLSSVTLSMAGYT